MGLPKTERQHDAIITLVDRLTKYVHVIPTKAAIDAEGAARLYNDKGVCLSWSNQTDSFRSRLTINFGFFFKEMFSSLGVELKISMANHH